MSNLGKRALFEPLRSINATSFTGSFQALGSPLINPSVCLKLINNTTVLVTVSFDGVNNHDIYPGGSFSIYDFGSDSQSVSGDLRLAMPQGTQIYVSASAGTGFFYAVTIFQGG
jgi:hypothetical protein